MDNKNYTTSFEVDQTPSEVFAAVLKPQEWWSDLIVGSTAKVGDIFDYEYQDIHKTKIKVIEVVQDQKVVWEVLENFFNFTKDKSEWVGNKMIFEITKEGDKTKLTFTQQGLVPEYECFEVCNTPWTSYINGSLKKLIETGEGLVSKKDEINGETKEIRDEMMKDDKNDFVTSILVDQSPEEVFKAIINPRGWWSRGIQGDTENLNDEFIFEVKGIHHSEHKLIEVIPNNKIVWLTTKSNLSFTEDKSEWTNTEIIFEISKEGEKTKLTFTHKGLVPAFECYGACSTSWSGYIKGSLYNLITTGKGTPNMEGIE
ncbi:MAG: SRPBCC domain-containing protein [Candidatus Dojkabacteria bacterium]